MRICLQNKRHQAKIPDLQCENYFQKPISSFVLEVEHQTVNKGGSSKVRKHMRSVLAITDRYSTDWCRSSLDDWEKCYGLPHSSITSLSKNEKNSGISLSSPSYSLQTLRISALKIHWKNSGIQGADFLSSWVRDQAMTERHARRNLDACSKRLRGNWKFGRFGDRLFPRKTHCVEPQISPQCIHYRAIDFAFAIELFTLLWRGGNLMGKQNKRRLTFRTAWSLQQNVSHLCYQQ